MSFFELSDSTNAAENNVGSFESGGNIEPMPSGTSVLAASDEAKWDTHKDEEFISIRWSVLAPKEYSGRKIFQKIRVLDGATQKADKAKRMLAAIDANAGGKLAKSGETPTNQTLAAALINKPMVLKLAVWEMDNADGSKGTGNWVAAVSPRSATTSATAKTPTNKPAPAPVVDDLEEGDIPF